MRSQQNLLAGGTFKALSPPLAAAEASARAPESVHDMKESVYWPIRSAPSRIMALSPPGTLKQTCLAAETAEIKAAPDWKPSSCGTLTRPRYYARGSARRHDGGDEPRGHGVVSARRGRFSAW